MTFSNLEEGGAGLSEADGRVGWREELTGERAAGRVGDDGNGQTVV